ncbi:MAG: hypothetical protein J5642_07980 [Bacteroidales bacterium]|nr:hypothetical protein [Bacteroidales bacterium]
MKRTLFFIVLCLSALAIHAQQYIDLGLPSGTLWMNQNQEGGFNGFYTYEEALLDFGDQLPTRAQFQELMDKCQWKWTGKGYQVTGPNGNSIFLPPVGFRLCDSTTESVGLYGDYWTSTPGDYEHAWSLYCLSGRYGLGTVSRCSGRSVRLVKNL